MQQFNNGDTAFLLISGALVLFMTPGLAYLYAGGSNNRGNVMHTIMSSFVALPVVTVQWFIWGYSLAFSQSNNSYIGNLNYAGMHNVYDGGFYPTDPSVPNMAFCFFQMMFAVITPAIIFSGAAERIKMGPFMIILFVWATIVYDPIAYWTWSPSGWFMKLGGLDTAGGMAVETASGFASLAMALALGPRKNKTKGSINTPMVSLGGAILWFGWIGFNAGSIGAANARAANAAFVTHLSGSVAAATWMLCDWILHKKVGVLSIVNGAVAGMVCITPACGYVQPASALAFGVVSAVATYTAARWRKRFADDPFDAFACHGVSGFIGMLLTGVFAEKKVIDLGLAIPSAVKGGWIDHNYIQLAKQLAGATSSAVYSFGMTFIIVKALMFIAKLTRTSIIHQDQDNIDENELGENAQAFLEPNKYFSETHSKKSKVTEMKTKVEIIQTIDLESTINKTSLEHEVRE
ncbi:Ammonium_transporter [Hexamita inflata]|uniref:Ammonium transporter n=1 Tax=Hexamita inflata TaxID=28002 RepID=A0ABP1GZE0_9EUKA